MENTEMMNADVAQETVELAETVATSGGFGLLKCAGLIGAGMGLYYAGKHWVIPGIKKLARKCKSKKTDEAVEAEIEVK